MDESTRNATKGKEKYDTGKLFYMNRLNTGQQVKQETLAELKKKYKKLSSED